MDQTNIKRKGGGIKPKHREFEELVEKRTRWPLRRRFNDFRNLDYVLLTDTEEVEETLEIIDMKQHMEHYPVVLVEAEGTQVIAVYGGKATDALSWFFCIYPKIY